MRSDLQKNGKVIPLGNPDTSDDGINGSKDFTTCSIKSSSTDNGIGCAYCASIDKNPDDETKTYWDDFINY